LGSGVGLGLAALVVVLGAGAGAARAGGFFLPTRGARALSHGGATVVSGDDLNAQWSNPATLFRSASWITVWGDLGLLNLNASFHRANLPQVMDWDDRYADGFPAVTSSEWFPDPAFAIGSNFGLKDWMFVIGMYGPYAGTTAWPDDDPRCAAGQSASACATQCYQDPASCEWNLGPQRYSLITPERLLLHYQVSAAYRPIEELSIGVGLFVASFMMKERMKISAYPGIFGWAEDPTLDALIELDAKDMVNFGAVIGVWGRPVRWLELGLAYVTPLAVRAKGKLSVRLPSSYYFNDTTVSGSRIRLDTNFPMVLRAGVRFVDPKERFDAELQVSWENWSTHDRIVVRPREDITFENVPGLGTYRVKTFTVREDFHDTVSVHLGSSVRAYRDILEVRAGYFWELGAIPSHTYTVQTIDSDKHAITCGLSAKRWGIRLDLTYAFVHLARREITDSTKRQINPLYEEDTGPYVDGRPTIVGNGRHRAHYHIVAMSASYQY
jgi:long-subunit fatty acid transport protein